jgi:3-hydroxymyristoyl/3-hydroxydecanoyl-(acyl carrier protein) dehydratase
MRFQFIDRIEKIQKYKYARGTKNISFEEGFLDSLNSEKGCIPRTLLIECAAQLVSWFVLYSTDFTKIPLIAKIDQAILEGSISCGNVLTVEIIIEAWNDDGALLNCSAFLKDRIIARGSHCLCTFSPADQLVEAEEMKCRFRELIKDGEIV